MSVITLSMNKNDRGTVTGGGTYDNGTKITVTAKNNSGYYFACWMIGDRVVSSNPSYTFTVESDVTLTAYFYNEVDKVAVYGYCDAKCKHRVMNVGQVISLIQEMAANGWEVPASYAPITAVNAIIEQNKGVSVGLFIGTQSEWDDWTGDKTVTYPLITDSVTNDLLNELRHDIYEAKIQATADYVEYSGKLSEEFTTAKETIERLEQRVSEKIDNFTVADFLGTEPIGSPTSPMYYDGEKFVTYELPVRSITLETASWYDITNIIKAGREREYFILGEEKTVTLADGTEVKFAIVQFTENGFILAPRGAWYTSLPLRLSTAKISSQIENYSNYMAAAAASLPTEMQGVGALLTASKENLVGGNAYDLYRQSPSAFILPAVKDLGDDSKLGNYHGASKAGELTLTLVNNAFFNISIEPYNGSEERLAYVSPSGAIFPLFFIEVKKS